MTTRHSESYWFVFVRRFGEFFFMSHYTISFGRFAKLSRQLDRGPLDGSVPSVADLIKEQSKSKAKCALAVLGLAFSLSRLILPGRRRAEPQTRIAAGVAHRVCVARAPL